MFLEAEGRISAGDDLLDIDLRDMAVATVGTDTYLYATTSQFGGVTAYQLSADGSLAGLVDVHMFDGAPAGQGSLSLITTASGSHLILGGTAEDGLAGFTLSSSGAMAALDDSLPAFAGPDAQGQGASHILSASAGDAEFAYAVDAYSGQISAYDLSSGGTGQTGVDTGLGHSPADALMTLETGTGSVLLATDQITQSVVSYTIDAGSGALTQAGLVGAPTGLGLHLPSVLDSVTAFGQTWIVVGAAGTSTLSVMQLDDTGALIPTDHVMDTLATRFGGVSALTVAQDGDRTFVIAGGADDGLSVFSLLPDGRLVHLETHVHTTGAGLQNVTGLTSAVVGDDIQIFVTSGTQGGITQLNIPLDDLTAPQIAQTGPATLAGTAGHDLLVGSDTGPDRLTGGGGDDVLVSGAGGAQMTGGGGADLFVVHGEAALTRITDFQAGVDRLDLSDLDGLRNTGQLDITQTATGATLSYGATTIDVTSQTGAPLTGLDLFGLGFDGPDRFSVTPAVDVVLGTAQDDRITGTGAADAIEGLAGADLITGNAGDDTISGGTGDDVIFGSAGDDRLDGEDGHDEIWGGGGHDHVRGGAGNDVLGGGSSGNDTLEGGSGDDEMWAGSDDDLLFGGDGNDTMGGSSGRDSLWGGAGDDEMWGGRHNDTVTGGDGNDVVGGGSSGNDHLYGGDGHDVFWANTGQDLLFGGTGNDLMGGGTGRDRVYGEDGNDELRLGRDDDTGYGGAGDDILLGVHGNDILDGGAGNDILSGGSGADEFRFNIDDGDDLVTDFQIGLDRVVISSGAEDFYDLNISRSGDDTVISLGSGEITLQDIDPDDLSPDDFGFG